MQITINQAEIIAAVKAHVENNLIQLRPGATVDVELIAARGGPERFSAIVDIENASPSKALPTAAPVTEGSSMNAAAPVSKATPAPATKPKTTMEDLKRQQAEEAAAEEAAEATDEAVAQASASAPVVLPEDQAADPEPEADETMAEEVAAEDAQAVQEETVSPADLALNQGTEDQPAAQKPSLFKGLKKPVNTPSAN